MTRHSLRPALESLETRDVPATVTGPKITLVEAQQFVSVAGGTVNATFAGGRLTVTGDAADNVLFLAQMDDGRLLLSANGSGTQIRLNGGPAGGTVTLPGPVTAGITINLGDGADQLIVDGVTSPGSLTINGGNGEAGPAGNTVYLHDVRVGGNLGITNRAGLDNTFLWGTVAVRGNLSVHNGAGGSNLTGDETTNLHVGGVFSVADGAGYDRVDLWGAINVAVGGLAVNTGTDFDGSYSRVHPFGDLSVNGSIRVTNGPGADFTDFGGQNLAVRGTVAIHNGGGGSFNTLLTWGTLYVGQVSITNGAGEDHNEIFSYDAAVIHGNATFANGAGDSTNGISANNALAIVGNVTFLNGAGRDQNGVSSTDARIGGSVVVRNGDGDSQTTIGADNNLLVQGPTRITAGAGFDQIHLGDNRVAPTNPAVDLGPVWMSLGDGGSDTEVSGGRLNVHGNLSITAGDGSDVVLVTTQAANGRVTGNLFVDLGTGDGQLVSVQAAFGQVLTVGGALGVSTEDPTGQSWTDLRGVDVHGWTDIWTGDGADGVLVTGSTFRGAFDVSTEGGNDVVYLEWAGGSTTFRSSSWIDTGDGSDQVYGLDAGPGGWLEFVGKATFDGGGGTNDLLSMPDNGNLFYHHPLGVTGFETAP